MNQKYVLCETYHNVNQLPRFFGTLEEARSAMVDQFNRYVNHSLPNDYDCKDTLAYCVSRYGGCKCRWDIFTVDFDNPNIVLTIDDGLPDIRFDSLGRPGTPNALRDGDTAKHIVLSERDSSATTRFVVNGSRPRSTHSTLA